MPHAVLVRRGKVPALAHGLLTGGRGYSATEPMGGDRPLLSIGGLAIAPSAETLEVVSKYPAEPGVGGHDALSAVMQKQVVRLLGREVPHGLFLKGFVPVIWKLQ